MATQQQMMAKFADKLEDIEKNQKTMATVLSGLAGKDFGSLSRNRRQLPVENGDVNVTEQTETSACTVSPGCPSGRDGRDGAPGRDGAAGRDGQPGPQGPIGEKGDIGPEGPPGEKGETGADGDGGGSVYIRWGRTTCPNDTDTSLIYDGIAGGTDCSHSGGGANYVCLPKDPEWGVFTDGNQGSAYMYGAEYQVDQFGNSPFQGASVYEHDVPCAVCHVASRGSKLMIPARLSCPSGWTREYKGYLMTERYTHYRSEFVCMDGEPETRPAGHVNHNGALFYPVEASCGSLPCPNYVQGRELTCVVCTK
ncbi:short-chain collagen C4-like [Branchiostoma floridae]|uniref:Short-chain collagen C4-like n=1 Tax=Branchiostoma floridae TaxID=7739 RepID=A0A9J7LSU0_BRAFL|nr:short-chain collagen C4-like [Branchiostoma floridae]